MRYAIAFVVAACGSAASPPAAPSPRPIDAGVATPGARPDAPGDARPDAPADAPDHPSQCRGRDVDLRAAFAGAACFVEGDEAPIPAGVEVRLDPAPTAPKGGVASTWIVLANPTATAVTLRLAYVCKGDPRVPVVTATLLDARGKPVGEHCNGASLCASAIEEIVIEAGGRARFPVEVQARAPVANQPDMFTPCTLAPGKPLRPGKYTVVISAQFLPESIRAPFVVD